MQLLNAPTEFRKALLTGSCERLKPLENAGTHGTDARVARAAGLGRVGMIWTTTVPWTRCPSLLPRWPRPSPHRYHLLQHSLTWTKRSRERRVVSVEWIMLFFPSIFFLLHIFLFSLSFPLPFLFLLVHIYVHILHFFLFVLIYISSSSSLSFSNTSSS